MSRIDTVQWGVDRLRVGPWRGDPTVAYIAVAAGPRPVDDALDECLRNLADTAYTRVLTAALGAARAAACSATAASPSTSTSTCCATR